MRQRRVLIFAGIIALGIAIGFGIWFLVGWMQGRERVNEITMGEHLYVTQLMPGVLTLPNGGLIDLRTVGVSFGRFNQNNTEFTLRFGNAATYHMVVSNFNQNRNGMTARMHTVVQGSLVTFDVRYDGNAIRFDAEIAYFVEVSYRDEVTGVVRQVRREAHVMTLQRGN